MTVQTFGYHTEPGFLARCRDAVARFFGALAEGRAAEARYHQLAQMSNGELARIGLTRADIPAAAMKPFDL